MAPAQLDIPAEGQIAYYLHQHLANPDRRRSIKNIHASDVTKEDYCAREWALYELTGIQQNVEFLGTARLVVFRQGNELANAVRGWLADIGLLWGDWKCMGCDLGFYFQRRPLDCPRCSAKTFLYEEVRFQSEVTGIQGGIDALILFPGEQLLRVVELKTIDKEEFKKLAMPLAEHRLRTNLYMRIVAESSHPHREKINTAEGIVFYISKGGFGRKFQVQRHWRVKDMAWTPFLDFRVARDDSATEATIRSPQALHQWRKGIGGMPQGVCRSSLCNQAQHCSVVGACFSGKYPAGTKKEM